MDIPNPNHFADVIAFGAGGLTALSSQMLGNSDFFTGAFPAEYGNALSGVFDLKLRTGNRDKREYTIQAGAVGLDFSSEGPFVSGGKSSYLFNYRYSTMALLTPLLPDDAKGTKYQDLSFKLNFPTRKLGVFSLWGLGANDVSGSISEKDPEFWIYEQDLQDVDSRQYKGTIGLNHKKIIGQKTYLHSTAAVSGRLIEWTEHRLNIEQISELNSLIENQSWTSTLSTVLNHKFNTRISNRTGITIKDKHYGYDMRSAATPGISIEQIVDETGRAKHFQAYSQFKLRPLNNVTINAGMHGQYFGLNNRYSIEPRLGLDWKLSEQTSISAAFGLHSQLEILNIYLGRQQFNGYYTTVNKDLDFSKAKHFVLGVNYAIGNNLHLKIEPYFQLLYNIPVIADSSFSIINLSEDWFVNDPMENSGKGWNKGVDVTLERFLQKGFYYVCSASIFDSKYSGGDGVKRNTRFNKGFVFNILGGKEWNMGKSKSNIFGINGRITYQGGNRISPVNTEISYKNMEVMYDDNKAFEMQIRNEFLLHFTLQYRRNKPEHSSIISLQFLNVLGAKEFYGYRYNLKEQTIDPHEEAIVIPNVSYKLEF